MNAIDERTESLEPTTIEPERALPAEEDAKEADARDDELERAQLDGAELLEPQADALESERPTRRKIEEQLEALKRKEIELRRALVMADHPELADSIRVLQGRTYALERVQEKLGIGLTKSELRRKETLQKKAAGLLEKRAELDAQIAEVEVELNGLGVERQQGFEAERQHALEELLVALGTHEPSLQAAGIEATELVPELTRWLGEIEVLAEKLAGHKAQAN